MASGMLSKLTSPFAVAIFWCLCLECASNALQDREQSNAIERERMAFFEFLGDLGGKLRKILD